MELDLKDGEDVLDTDGDKEGLIDEPYDGLGDEGLIDGKVLDLIEGLTEVTVTKDGDKDFGGLDFIEESNIIVERDGLGMTLGYTEGIIDLLGMNDGWLVQKSGDIYVIW